MNTLAWALIVFAAVGVAVWLISFAVEALKPTPKAPDKLRWAPNIPIRQRRSRRQQAALHQDRQRPGPGSPAHLAHPTGPVRENRAGARQALHRLCLGLSGPRLFGYSQGALRRGVLYRRGRRLPRQARSSRRHARRSLDRRFDLPDRRRAAQSARGAGHRHQSLRLRQRPRHGAQLAARLGRQLCRAGPLHRRDGDAAQEFPHHEIGAQRRRRRPEQHSAGAHAGDVSCGESPRPLSRVHQPAPQLGKLGDRGQGLRAHRNSRSADLGRPGLGAARQSASTTAS